MCEEINEKNYIKKLFHKAVVFSAALLLFLASCTQEAVQTKPSKSDSIVSTRLFNAKYTLKDSGYTQVFLRSPIVEMYELIDTPVTIFPKGLELNFYKKGASKPGYLRAAYAKIIDTKGWYEAIGNVIIINDTGDSLKTQKLYWNAQTHKIFTPDTTHIIRVDGSIIHSYNGMEASEDFKTFKFFNNNRGNIFVKD